MKEIALHLLDLIENAARAGAQRIEIRITEDPEQDVLDILVIDDGSGMSEETARAATEPFTTTKEQHSVGLGLSLLAAAAELAGGECSVESALGEGTTVRARFQLSHIDRAPLGRIDETLAAAAVLHPAIAVCLLHFAPGGSYTVETRSVTETAGGIAGAGRIRELVAAGLRSIASQA